MQLNQAEITQQSQQKYLISGMLDFSTVPGLMQRFKDFLKSYKKTVSKQSAAADKLAIDMSKITDCDSSGLALLLEIVRYAHSNNMKIHFEHLPDTLLTIAKAYGIESEIREFCK